MGNLSKFWLFSITFLVGSFSSEASAVGKKVECLNMSMDSVQRDVQELLYTDLELLEEYYCEALYFQSEYPNIKHYGNLEFQIIQRQEAAQAAKECGRYSRLIANIVSKEFGQENIDCEDYFANKNRVKDILAEAERRRQEDLAQREIVEISLIKKVEAPHPRRLAMRGIEGFVEFEFTVNETGDVKDYTMKDGDVRFYPSAWRALVQYKYSPRLIDGKPVSTEGVTERIDFLLSKPKAGEPASREIYAKAIDLMRSRGYLEAIDIFQSIVNEYRPGEYTAVSFFWLGELYNATGDPTLAIENFLKLITLFPESPKVPDALLNLGTIYIKQEGNKEEGREYLRRVIEEYPDTSAAELAGSYLE